MSKSFTFNPKPCLIEYNNKPNNNCVFDYWSIQHFYWQGFIYIILHHILKIKVLKNVIILGVILTLLHIVEEYLGNTSKISLEGIIIDNIGPIIIDPNINFNLRKLDNDYLDNSIGDILSGIISTILIISYWYYFNKLPYFYLLFSIIIIHMLLKITHLLYDN